MNSSIGPLGVRTLGRSPSEVALDLALRHATYLIFLAVILYFGVQSPVFLGPESLGNVVKQASFIGIAAIGMTFVLLTGGNRPVGGLGDVSRAADRGPRHGGLRARRARGPRRRRLRGRGHGGDQTRSSSCAST